MSAVSCPKGVGQVSTLPQAAVLMAPAKLTLSLQVTGVRSDGYHLIDAEMVSLDFGDSLTIEPGIGVRYEGAWTGEAGDGDLVTKALRLVGERRRVTVAKRVPAGAGLGGGSSDAAAILRAAGHRDLVEAAAIGADVAFCVVGGRARVQGIGDLVTPLPFVERAITLLTPAVHCSTPAVYAEWDAMGGPTGDNGNDLEPAALRVAPELAQARDRLSDHAGLRARLAGSGSTWFVEGAFPGPGLVVTRAMPPH